MANPKRQDHSKQLQELATRNLTTSKHLAIWEWLYVCPLFNRLFYMFSSSENGDITVLPDDILEPTATTAENVIQGYITGLLEKEFIFTMIFILPKETTANEINNIEWANVVEGVADWIAEQNKIENFPNFGELNQIERIETVQAGDAVAAADETGAKYQFSVRIVYKDLTNVRS